MGRRLLVITWITSLVSFVAVASPTIQRRQNDQFQSFLSQFANIKPSPPPTTLAQAYSMLNSIVNSLPISGTSLFTRAADLIQNGFYSGPIQNFESQFTAGDDGLVSPPSTTDMLYPAGSTDAPFTISQSDLLGAIRIPGGFTFGQKPPVILVPGTGSTGYLNYAANYLKLLGGVDFADPVYLNIPHFMLDNAQLNSQYIAYAINYISAVSNHQNVSVIAWSQGNLDTQWALKFWPSTRSKVTDFIGISPDFHGTAEAYLICLGAPELGCTPSVIQQEYSSAFVTALRALGGDSAYVPTTTIYSETDEIVQPQSGVLASAFLKDARGVGVTNVDIQSVCGSKPAGGLVTHEGVLYNALAFALAVDALKNPGPGSLARINTAEVCQQQIAPGLDVGDFLGTEAILIEALLAVILYPSKTATEPPLQPYAFT